MADMIQVRRDTAALWVTTNPILASGEFGHESDTGKLKIGDGTTTWTSLAYFTALVDGITSTTAELNILDGVTATAAELNILDGVTSTAAELNYVDGVTSNIQTQLNAAVAAAGDLSNVIEDTTPQLGGNLDVQSSEITTSTSNGNIKVTPNGSGVFEVKGAGGGDGTLQLNCSANTHGVKIKSPPHSAAASYTLTLPNNDGDANQMLQTNGSGVLTWGDALPTIIRSARTTNTILGTADQGRLIDITGGTVTQTFNTAASLGNGWYCDYKNSGTGIVKLEPATYGSELFVDGDFSNVNYGSNICVNGTFSSTSNWTLAGGTTISGGKANVNLTTNAIVLTQTGAAPVAGETYKVTYTLSNWSAAGARPNLGGVNGTNSSYANGTYTSIITTANTSPLNFIAFNNSNWSIDNITVQPYATLKLVGPMAITGAAVVATNANSGDYVGSSFTGLTAGANYLFEFTLSNHTATNAERYLEVDLTGGTDLVVPSEKIWQNGTYSLPFTATAAHTLVRIKWMSSSTSSAVIDDCSLKPVLNAIDNQPSITLRHNEALTISSDGSNFTTSRTNPKATAKAWLVCDKHGGIISSYNVASITDTGTGKVTVTLDGNMESAEYVILVSSSDPDAPNPSAVSKICSITSQTKLSFIMQCSSTSNSVDDPEQYNMICFGG